MGRCITIITLSGATSLGLLTGSLAYQSAKAIPELIRQLKNQASLTTASAEGVLSNIKTNLTISNVVNAFLAAVSTWAFSTSYRFSPAAGKHPYLIYSALGAPLALAAFWYQTGTKACGITGPFSGGKGVETIIKENLAKVSEKFGQIKRKQEVKDTPEVRKDRKAEDSLDQSYIHISEESDSSPETPIEVTQSVSSSIEDEVDAALNKKERVAELETVASAYNVSSVIAGVAFVICSIGVVGDQFFL